MKLGVKTVVSYFYFHFFIHNLLHQKKSNVIHSSGLIYFSNIMFILASFFFVVVLFSKKLFLFKFSPINCSGDANEFTATLCFKGKEFSSAGKDHVLAKY